MQHNHYRQFKNREQQQYLRREKIRSYLLQTNINNTPQDIKDNLSAVGVVLGLNTRIQYNDSSIKYYLISVLLFLDLRTARVERYLINTSEPSLNDKGIDLRNDVFYIWNNEKYRIFHDEEHSFPHVTLSALGDGKLTRKLYTTFMAELARDYLMSHTSYNDGNMTTLRKLTAPSDYVVQTKSSDDINTKEYKTLALGTGVITDIEKQAIAQSNDYSLRKLESFKASRFYMHISNPNNPENTSDLNNDKTQNQKLIFLPNQFNNRTVENWYENTFNFKLIYTQRKELPPIVQDLTRTLSMKTIKHPAQIAQRIQTFNHNIVYNLKQWTKTPIKT